MRTTKAAPTASTQHPGAKLPNALIPRIVYEDANLVVLVKPPGLLSQGERQGDPNLVDWLRDYFGRNYVGLVHRLDRNTSGLMVVAKRTKAAQRLSAQLQEGNLNRKYLAWVIGDLKASCTWRHVLMKDARTNTVRVLNPTQTSGQSNARAKAQAKDAILQARPLQRKAWKNQVLTLVEFKLETGRSHQIRVQAAAEGFPLLGDRKYGNSPLSFPRPALHSSYLEFNHPISDERMKFEEPLPKDLSLSSS